MIEYYGNNDYRDYLMHYGIPGMKWGRRKIKAIKDAIRPHTRSYKRAHANNERANWNGANRTLTEHWRKGHENFDRYDDIQKEMWFDRNKEINEDRHSSRFAKYMKEHVDNYYPKDERKVRETRDKALRVERTRRRRKREKYKYD